MLEARVVGEGHLKLVVRQPGSTPFESIGFRLGDLLVQRGLSLKHPIDLAFMIKSGGENVYPREVDEVLCRHPKVKEAVVVVIPMGLRGELIKAFVVLRDGEKTTAAELLDHCRKELAKFKVPKKIEFRTALPKTVIGKVLRRVLLDEELQKRRADDLQRLEADEPS